MNGLERERRAKELFAATLELEGHERAAYLGARCAGDEALLTRVSLLLEAAERADGFLAEPPAGPRVAEVDEQPGARIGPAG